MKKSIRFVVLSAVCLLLSACGGSGPGEDLLEEEMSGRLPAAWQQLEFDAQESIPLGEGTGRYRTEFEILIAPRVDLYSQKGRFEGVYLIEKQVEASAPFKMKGYIDSVPAANDSWANTFVGHYTLPELAYRPLTDFPMAVVAGGEEHLKLVRAAKDAEEARGEEAARQMAAEREAAERKQQASAAQAKQVKADQASMLKRFLTGKNKLVASRDMYTFSIVKFDEPSGLFVGGRKDKNGRYRWFYEGKLAEDGLSLSFTDSVKEEKHRSRDEWKDKKAKCLGEMSFKKGMELYVNMNSCFFNGRYKLSEV